MTRFKSANLRRLGRQQALLNQGRLLQVAFDGIRKEPIIEGGAHGIDAKFHFFAPPYGIQKIPAGLRFADRRDQGIQLAIKCFWFDH
ncbi:MAG: hypothetical protein ACREOI_35630 [bacterium]